MLCLFETPAGFALFKVLKENKLKDLPSLWQEFTSLEKAAGLVKLKAFTKFEDTTDALAAAANLVWRQLCLSCYTDSLLMLVGVCRIQKACMMKRDSASNRRSVARVTIVQVDSKVPKQLKKFLKKNCGEDKLAVVDAKLGKAIATKLGLAVTSGAEVLELTRGIRSQMEGLLTSLDQQSITQMSLGLSHSLSRYKLKFSPDKIDTMVVQAIGLLDELDKELNTYAMRVREWYVQDVFQQCVSCVCERSQHASSTHLITSNEPMQVWLALPRNDQAN
jgi:nucleolar protein 58